MALRHLGCQAFGESRDQEAAQKVEEIRGLPGCDSIRWHMVGRIQRNKARSVAEWAYAAHSVDNAKVIAALDRAAAGALGHGRRTEPLRVYLQISLDGDEAAGWGGRRGRRPHRRVCAAIDAARGFVFVGLMAIPPLGRGSRRLHSRVCRRNSSGYSSQYPHRLGLSAGMSGDLEAAVEHGSLVCVSVPRYWDRGR